jgi:hypothetical protein
MARMRYLMAIIIIWGFFLPAFAQLQESPIKIFGYFQNQFK